MAGREEIENGGAGRPSRLIETCGLLHEGGGMGIMKLSVCGAKREGQ